MRTTYIISAMRTPLGSFGGQLKGFSATELGSLAIKGALEKSGVDPSRVDEVFMGNVCQANLGQAPARQAALGAGIPVNVPCTTVNKVCASGMKSIMFGSQAIALGDADIVVAGGMESMSNIPFYAPSMRWGQKYGHNEMVDGLQKDGLTDAYNLSAMGKIGDSTAKKYGFTREDQDDYAIESYRRAEDATANGRFENEIVAVSIPQRKGEPVMMKEDEEFKNVFLEKISRLRPAFSKDGTVTAANASTINDGASALVLVSEEIVHELGLKPLAKIISYADAAHDPDWFTTAPAYAVPRALSKAGMKTQDVDLFEVNEAFSVVPLVFSELCKTPLDRMNINGGAVSLGHPLGCSGARITTTLIHALQSRDEHVGCATLCNGGGGASAIIIERM